MGLAVDSYLLPTSKSRDTKSRTKIESPALMSFRYCPLIEESVVICHPPLQIGEEIAFENGLISDFQGLVTLTFYIRT